MKFVKLVSTVILFIALLSIYSYFVVRSVRESHKTSSWQKPLLSFSTFTETVLNVFSSPEIKGNPPSYTKLDRAFIEINQLENDLFALNSFFNKGEDRWDIRLFNLKTDSLVFEWHLPQDLFFKKDSLKKFDRSPPRSSIMLNDRSLLVDLDGSNNLFRIDEHSDVIWHNTDKMFHHAMNLDADSMLWIGTKAQSKYTDFETGIPSYYEDDFLTGVNIETGQIEFDKSITDLFVENNLEGLIYGQSNSVSEGLDNYDPIHLNDIEPVLSDGPNWQKGDLFVSLRNRSLIFLYRPSSNEVLKVISGPFVHQHDVDIISNHEISLFNNNVSRIGSPGPIKGDSSIIFDYSMGSSEIIIYDFENHQFKLHLQEQMQQEQIFTFTEGMHTILSSGTTFIESQNSGKLYLINKDGVVFRKYLRTKNEDLVEQPNWMRIYESINF